MSLMHLLLAGVGNLLNLLGQKLDFNGPLDPNGHG